MRSSLMQTVEDAATFSGITLQLVEAKIPEASINGEALFRGGPLLIRLLRDRGQDFVDVAPGTRPSSFHMYCDVEIAFGWATVDEVLGYTEPKPIRSVFAELNSRMAELVAAFAEQNVDATLARIDQAAKMRGDAYMDLLKR